MSTTTGRTAPTRNRSARANNATVGGSITAAAQELGAATVEAPKNQPKPAAPAPPAAKKNGTKTTTPAPAPSPAATTLPATPEGEAKPARKVPERYSVPKPALKDIPTEYPPFKSDGVTPHPSAGKKISKDNRERLLVNAVNRWLDDKAEWEKKQKEQKQKERDEENIRRQNESAEKSLVELKQEAAIAVSNAAHESRQLTPKENEIKAVHVNAMRGILRAEMEGLFKLVEHLAAVVKAGVYESYDGATKRKALEAFCLAELGESLFNIEKRLRAAKMNAYLKEDFEKQESKITAAIEAAGDAAPHDLLLAKTEISAYGTRLPKSVAQLDALAAQTGNDPVKAATLWKEAVKDREARGGTGLPSAADVRETAVRLGFAQPKSTPAASQPAKAITAAAEAEDAAPAQEVANPFAAWNNRVLLRRIRGIMYIIEDRTQEKKGFNVYALDAKPIANVDEVMAALATVNGHVQAANPDQFDDNTVSPTSSLPAVDENDLLAVGETIATNPVDSEETDEQGYSTEEDEEGQDLLSGIGGEDDGSGFDWNAADEDEQVSSLVASDMDLLAG